MKKKRFSQIVLCALLAVACMFGSAQAFGETAAHRVEPTAPTLDMANLTDCTFAASFDPEDVYLDDDGALVIHMTVYDPELFEPDEIAKLAVGDTILIDGEEQNVTSLETTEDGCLLVNGGFDQDGFTMVTNESGAYYVIGASDQVNYRALGETTLRVAQDFTLEDSSEFDRPANILYAGDLLSDGALDELFFVPSTTEVTLADGAVTSIKVYPGT